MHRIWWTSQYDVECWWNSSKRFLNSIQWKYNIYLFEKNSFDSSSFACAYFHDEINHVEWCQILDWFFDLCEQNRINSHSEHHKTETLSSFAIETCHLSKLRWKHIEKSSCRWLRLKCRYQDSSSMKEHRQHQKSCFHVNRK